MKHLIIVLFLFCTACNSSNKGNSDIDRGDACDCDIQSIHALYYNYNFDTARALGWDDIQKWYDPQDTTKRNRIVEATITECSILQEIDKEIKTLKPAEEQYPGDARIALTINMKDGTIKEYVIGWPNTAAFYTKEYKGTLLESENTNRLLYLIKNNIGYYSWFDQDDLKSMNELNDPSVQRDSVRSRDGKIYYYTPNIVEEKKM
ncbi:hypothetical protein [Dysgonomonas sp. 25]|uniref:hypothetical protein n=1 Tax=Dysgonomonas sp. 25 TaxID=2302933 RepID=UPI0013D80790|nr:hypothetical protein [Dysgonomonas sp. 25]NDV67883.1 hypothetical protein [Dysgonomonas sp. 25]